VGKLQFTQKLHGFDGAYELLRSLPAEVVSKRGGPVKTGLRKGALVIHRQALANLTTVASAQMLEYGSRTQPAELWLRPAATSRAAEAISTIEKETVAAIARVVKRLEKARGPR
jgi:hypothetical protein